MPQPLGPSPVRFAANGPISLAYQVLGDGPTTVLVVTGWVLPMESIWDDPAYARFIERLAADARVVLLDKRGTGMSDRVSVDRLPTLEQRMDDLGAVLDAVGAEEATSWGCPKGRSWPRSSPPPTPSAPPRRCCTAGGRAPSATAATRGCRPARSSTRSQRASRRRGTTWASSSPCGRPPSSGTRPCAPGGRARCTAAPAPRRRSPGCGCWATSTSARPCRGSVRRHSSCTGPAIGSSRPRTAAGSPSTCPAPATWSSTATTTCGGSATRTPCCARSRTSSAAPRRASGASAAWRP